MTRYLLATLAFGLSLGLGVALGSIGRGHTDAADTDIPTLPPTAAVFVAPDPNDQLFAERNLLPAAQSALLLADSLGLSPEQRQQLRRIQADVEAQVAALGRRIVLEEMQLERAAAEGRLDAPRIDAMTARIAALQGQLRAVRLQGHVATRDVLQPEQLLRFAEERGFEPARTDASDDFGG